MLYTTSVDIHYLERGVTIPAGTELEVERTRFPGLSFYTRYQGKSYIVMHDQLVDLEPEDFDLTDEDNDVILG